MRTNLFLLAALALILLPGCGGGGVSHVTRGTGSATVSIVWPKPTRLIPAAAASIKIEVSITTKATMTNPPPTTNIIATKVVPRPAAGGTTTVKIEGLPIDTVTNTITAFPNADGTGVPQAAGTMNLKILEDNSASVTVTLDSTIDHIVLSPNAGQVVSIGSTLAITAEPRDVSERQVLILPTGLDWVSSDPTVATVDTKGLMRTVTALKTGTTTITVTEPESMKTASVSVTVGAGDYVLSTSDGGAIGVDDNLGIWLNGVSLYYDPRGAFAGFRGPFHFAAKPGDKIRIQVQDWYGFHAGVDAIYVTTPAGVTTLLQSAIDEETPQGNQEIILDQEYTLP